MRWWWVALSLPFLTACLSSDSGGEDGIDCVSHYNAVADAATRNALMRELREDVDPRVRSLKVMGDHPDEGKVYVNLLNRRHRNVMSLEMWQQDDGTWTAQAWSQCID